MVRTGKGPSRLSAEAAAAVIVRLSRQLESERSGVARRLHSDVAGMLAAARMDLSQLASRGASDAELAETLRRVDRLLERVIGDARAEMQRLYPALLDHFGLAAALRHRIEEACRACGAEFTTDLPELLTAPAADAALAAYRVVETLLRAPGLRRVDARLRPADPLQLLNLEFEHAVAIDAVMRDDLRALRVWLESLGARWGEGGQDGVFRLELRLPPAQ